MAQRSSRTTSRSSSGSAVWRWRIGSSWRTGSRGARIAAREVSPAGAGRKARLAMAGTQRSDDGKEAHEGDTAREALAVSRRRFAQLLGMGLAGATAAAAAGGGGAAGGA